ncbi:MAG: hypothetical protein AB7F88_11405 [Pyrinomonadaceae bacterium]
MKYLTENGYDRDAYVSYLESIRDRLPEHVMQFASDPDLFYRSFHDSWLDYLNIVEVAAGERMEERSTEIEVRLLGPFHDRRVFIRYKGVIEYQFRADNVEKGHGDLLLHEVHLGDDSELIHELEFDRHRTMVIRCRDLIHWEDPYSYK